MASEMRPPILLSPLAEMVATCAISSGVVTGRESAFRFSLIASTAIITPGKPKHTVKASTSSDLNGVGPTADLIKTFLGDGAGQNGGRGRPVSCFFVGVVGHVLDQPSPDVLELVLQLHPLRHGYPILCDLGTPPRLLQNNVATLHTTIATAAVSRRLIPLMDRVLIQKAEAITKTKGGIVLPEKAQSKVLKGTVVAVGPGSRNNVRTF
ncbi:unnamed protein product, partial [Timema podura]|nr:unnamed protein product [Timema podura]